MRLKGNENSRVFIIEYRVSESDLQDMVVLQLRIATPNRTISNARFKPGVLNSFTEGRIPLTNPPSLPI